LYVVKKDEFWKKVTKFWMKLFAINFAVGVATGIILEFEFGTNWSNYSWFVGDIFGAPLAIEGIFAFFMESTFFAVMFFGWNKVSKRFHLSATWLTALGTAISAFWILVANSWMQHPVGTEFNVDTVRSEMVSFWAVVSNPIAISKFFHSVFSGWMTGAVFVAGVSCWFLLKKRETKFAYASIIIACCVGLSGGLATMLTGDSSGIHAAKYQPMKLAAAEGLEDGGTRAPFSIVPGVEVPAMLSILATHDIDGYVPGINDIINGYTDNEGNKVLAVGEKMERGKIAIQALREYRETKETNPEQSAEHLRIFRENEKYMGYGYLEKPEDVVPNVPLIFWSFRVMVGLGSFLMLLLVVLAWTSWKKKLEKYSWLQWVTLFSIPLVYLCGQAGWIVAEAGRQPWTIQDLLPVNVAVSSLSTSSVQTTFFIFLTVFALFLIIELSILCKAIAKGPEMDK
ncbi:MAG: cytochrome ubiquinol oxidase subunit I, partial [Fibrobacter sp.]|nr:cytochrome ubiquinol oxidase subunit I [Bacteroidales bacterium]MCF0224593.1 cytochrome ubiquinol oxidase subunit I [Fibrobacter sp.]